MSKEEAVIDEEEVIIEEELDGLPEEEAPEEEVVDEEPSEEPDEEEPDEEEEDVITLDDEVLNEEDPEEKKAPKWVKDLRKKHREEQRKVKELQAKLKELETQPPAQQPVTDLRKKPTIEDHDWDAEAFEQDYARWVDEKQEYSNRKKAEEEEREKETRTWQEKLDNYNKEKKDLKVRDYEEVESSVLESLSDTQKGIILQGAENAALLVYAIGKSKDKAEALAKITDPVKFAFEVAKIESKLKITRSTSKPDPEKRVSGRGVSRSAVQNQLEKLREQAAKTGDFTAVYRYKKKHNL